VKRPPVLTGTTTQPPTRPPDDLCCPQCLQPLTYRHTSLGGVRAIPEQWDHFDCGHCGGEFEYRHRTRKLKSV
jgi:hypothetical protein